MDTECTKTLWLGRIVTALAALPFIFSCAMKFMGGPQIVTGMEHMGWPQNMIITLAVLEATCVVLYLIPPISVLGAVLLTGYLGGAIATHLRIGEPVYMHIAIGIFIWLGLFLREPRLRAILPVRGKDFTYTREITINQPPEAVFAFIKPLKNFDQWNPFIKKDPDVKKTYQGTDGTAGFVASWIGNRNVGEGEQELTRIIDGKRVEFQLRFKKPFAATNTGYFACEPVGSAQTKVSWSMSGQPTFPMTVFGFLVDCDKMIGKEFESGLADLKRLLESPSKT